MNRDRLKIKCGSMILESAVLIAVHAVTGAVGEKATC